jgi:hypothetical protein
MSDCKCWKCEALVEKGRRLERRVARRIVLTAMTESKHEHCDACWYLGEIVLEKLGATTKPAKRKEGGSPRKP